MVSKVRHRLDFDRLRQIILTYNEHRTLDPFMRWFRERDAADAFSSVFEKILIVLIDARFSQRTKAENALENTKRVFRIGALKRGLERHEIPLLIPRYQTTADRWTHLFSFALPKMKILTKLIRDKRAWRAKELIDLLLAPQYKAPYMGVKTSRLAVRWLFELIPELKIKMTDYEIPVDSLVHRISCRLGVVNPEHEKYAGRFSPADLKIQAFAKQLFPDKLWIVDEPLWSTGRKASDGGHCYPNNTVFGLYVQRCVSQEVSR